MPTLFHATTGTISAKVFGLRFANAPVEPFQTPRRASVLVGW
jgi:hypothetical protein